MEYYYRGDGQSTQRSYVGSEPACVRGSLFGFLARRVFQCAPNSSGRASNRLRDEKSGELISSVIQPGVKRCLQIQ